MVLDAVKYDSGPGIVWQQEFGFVVFLQLASVARFMATGIAWLLISKFERAAFAPISGAMVKPLKHLIQTMPTATTTTAAKGVYGRKGVSHAEPL